MIGTIRKHSTWLWAIIIVVVIITFVFWGSQSPNSNNYNAREGYLGSIAGEPVKLDALQSAAREVMLGFFFNYGEFPGDDAKRMGFDVDREAYIRLFLIKKLNEMNIYVSDETVVKKAGDILRIIGRGNPVPFAEFEKQVLAPRRFTARDFENFVRHEVGRQQLVSAVAAAGRLVTPQEARVLYEREHEELATEAVFFNATNYLSGVSVTPEAVRGFFTNQMARYRLPERVQVKYVDFDISNYLAEAEAVLMKTNLNELIEGNYNRLGTNLYREAKTPEEAKKLIREDLIKEEATVLARRAANDFANLVDDQKSNPPKLEDFEKLAAEKNYKVQTTAPFDSQEGPTNMVVMANFMKEAFARTPDEPFAGPLAGRDAIYVIALEKRLPSEIPPFESIRDEVTRDFKMSQATLAAQTAGAKFATTLTNKLAEGKKFTSIALEANVKPLPMPPLSLSTRSLKEVEDHVSLYQYKQAAFTAAEPGRTSGFVPTAEGGFVVYVRERMPMDIAKMNAELPDFIERVRSMRQNEAYNEWFRREAERSLRDTPLFQRQQASGGPAAAQ